MRSLFLTYERVSTEEQTRTKSCDDQKTTNDRHVLSIGGQLAENGDYRDEGISGTKADRPGLQDLLIRCEKDPSIKAVVVTEADRLGRGILTYVTIREQLKKFGVKIIAVTQPMIDDSEEGETIGELLGVINGLFPKMTRRKSMRALDEKAARGWFPQKAPLGYKNINVGTEDRPERIIAVNDDEAIYIREIPKLYNQGKSYREISSYLYDIGLRGHQEGKVSSSEIRNIIFNDFYLGTFMWRGKKYQGNHTPIFNAFEVYKARAASNELGHVHTTDKLKGQFPFKSIPILCKDCQCKVTAEKKIKFYKRTNREAEYILYHCSKSKGGWRQCRQPTINKDTLIAEFAKKAVEPISIDEEIAEFMFEEMNNEAAFRAGEREKMLENIRRRLGQLETELRNLFEMYVAGKIIPLASKSPEQLYEESRLKREMDRGKLLSLQEKLLGESTAWQEKASNFFSLCTDATNKFLNASEEKQANFLKVITSNVFLDNKKLVVTHQFPFSILEKSTDRTTLLRD